MDDHKRMISRGVRFHPTDWQTIKEMAKREGVTPGLFLNMLAKAYALQHGFKWIGGQKWGRPRKDK